MTFKIHFVYEFIDSELRVTKRKISIIDAQTLKFVWKYELKHFGYAKCYMRKSEKFIKKTFYFKEDYNGKMCKNYKWLSRITNEIRRDLKINTLFEK